MRDIADLLDDAEIAVYVDGRPVISDSKENDKAIKEQQDQKDKKKPRPHFTFDLVNLPIGTMIKFDPTGVMVRVATDCKIEYEDRLWSLSAFTGTYLPAEQQNTSGAYQGPKFFSYEGKTLWQLRLEKKNKPRGLTP